MGGLFHRDNELFQMTEVRYVSLIFNNENEETLGSEILPTAKCYEDRCEETGEKVELEYLKVCRPLLLPSYASIGFNDSLVQHATPSFDDKTKINLNDNPTLSFSSKRLPPDNFFIREAKEAQRTFVRVWTQILEEENYHSKEVIMHRKDTFTVEAFRLFFKNNDNIYFANPPPHINLANLDYVDYIRHVMPEICQNVCDNTLNRGGRKTKKNRITRKRKTKRKQNKNKNKNKKTKRRKY